MRCGSAPVLTAQHGETAAYTADEALKNELKLVYGGSAGKSGFRVAAEHYVVGDVYREVYDILEHKGPEYGDEGAIEALVTGHYHIGYNRLLYGLQNVTAR